MAPSALTLETAEEERAPARTGAVQERPGLGLGGGSPMLVLASTAYLVLPAVIFALGWLRPLVGWPLAALLVAGVVRFNPSRPAGGHQPEQGGAIRAGARSFRSSLTLVGLGFALAWLSGAGGFAYQTADWWKHNAVLNDLTVRPWPVLYSDQPDLGLSYYTAFYLPPAAVGKLFGWWAANAAALLWTGLGLSLLLNWITRFALAGSRGLRFGLVCFFAWGGLDLLGRLLFPAITGLAFPIDWSVGGIELWNDNFVSASGLTSLVWATNHAVGGWLVTALILDRVWGRRDPSAIVLWVAATALWSPFVVVGLLPFVVVALAPRPARGIRWLSIANLGGLVLGLVLLAYYQAKTAPLPADLAGGLPIEPVLASARYPLASHWLLVALGLFVVLEWVIPIVVLARYGSLARDERCLLGVAMVSMALCLPIQVGENHDLLQRGALPGLMVLALLAGRALARARPGSTARLVLLAVLVLAAATPAIELRRNLTEDSEPVMDRHRAEAVPSVDELFGSSPLIGQYIASTESFFFRELARR